MINNQKLNFVQNVESRSSGDLNKDFELVWDSYSDIYELIDKLPHVKELKERHVDALKDCKFILDAGCGPGLITRDLAKIGMRVRGIDINKDMLRHASERLSNFKNVELYHGSVLELPFSDEMFDGYISNNVLHFVDDKDRFFSEMMRVTKPGAVISIASAKPGCNIEILIDAAKNHFLAKNASKKTMAKIEQMAIINRSLMKSVSTLLEPHEIANILKNYGYKSITLQGIAYLGQSFHVIARK